MHSFSSFLIAVLIGTVVIVNGVTLNTHDILNETKTAVNGANLHQITTALEFYYIDYGHYPSAEDGEELIELLKTNDYISGDPLDASIFTYQSESDGQNYELSV